MDSIVYKNDSTGPHSLLQEKWQHHSRQSEHTEKCPRLLLDDGVKRQRCFVCGIELASEKYVEHIQSAAHRINLQRLGGGGDGVHTNAKDDAEKAEMSSAVAEYDSSGGYRGYNDNDFEARNAEGEAEYYGSLWKTAKSLPPPPPPPPPPMLEHPRTDALLAEALAQLARLRAERAGRGEKAERNARSFSWRYRNELEAEVEPVEAAESSRSGDDRSSNRRRRQRERCDSATETLIVTPLETCRTDATGAELLLHRSARDVPSQETTMRQTRDAAVATETDLETATSSAATKQLSVPAAVEVKEEKPTADRFDFASQMPTPRLAASTDSEVAAINGLADAAVQKEAEEEAEVSDRTASPLPHRSREVERMQAALELSLQADQVDDVIGEVDDRIADLRRQVEALNEQIAAEEAVREELQQKRLEILQRRVDVLRGCFELPVLNGGEPSSARFARDDFCETENAASPSPPPPPQQQQQSFPADFETDAETGQSGSEVQRQSLVHRVLLDDSEASAANGGGPLAVDSPRDADLIQQTLDRLSALSQPPPPPSKQVQQGRRRPRKQCQPAEPELPPAEVLSDVLSAAPREPPSRPASAAALAGDDGKARISRRTASETRLPIDEACAGRGSSNVNNSTSHRRPRRRRVSSGRSQRDDPAFAAALREYLHATSGSGSTSSDADAESSADRPSKRPIRLDAHPGAPVLSAVSHNGLLYTGSASGTGAVLCLATRRRLADFHCGDDERDGGGGGGGGGGIICLALCDGLPNRLLACASNGVVSLHDARSGRRLAQWRLPSELSAARASHGRLYLGLAGGRLATCDLAAPAKPTVLTGLPALNDAVTAVESMPADSRDRQLIIGCASGSIRMFDESTGRELAALGSHARHGCGAGAVLAIRAPDSCWICSLSECAALVHSRTERQAAAACWSTRRLLGPIEPVRLAALETVSRWLLVGCSDGSVRCFADFNRRSNSELAATILIGSRHRPITSLAVCQDSRLACGDAAGQVELRHLPAAACDDDYDDDDDEDTPTRTTPTLPPIAF
ncbi:hypothetical protein BOX15_Mlig026487g2 [Macrostomum lignano]|uniref:Uncharacterized protein n=1 Tax=Macrostomum lignano TaxID=282301 RepID=A0A267GVS3_9PLAT|nr:hypothetical protein BOX15_Mlig026487g2 [Macrostomum lignano]